MAQEVGFMEDNITYTEGPFVISNPLGNGWRIEVELRGHKCPILPGSWYEPYIQEHGFQDGKYWGKEEAERLCDFLNTRVSMGDIVLVNEKTWLPKALAKLIICPECTHEFFI